MKKLLATLLISASAVLLSTVSHCTVIYGEEVNNTEAAQVSENTKYLTEDTYLYQNAGDGDILGLIKQGSNVDIEEDGDSWVRITYAGKQGYIDKTVLDDEPPIVKEKDSEGNEEEVQYLTSPEILYPASHYYESFGEEAAADLLKYTTNSDTTDDYVLISNSDDIKLPKGVITYANANGCDALTIYYTEDKQTPVVYLQIKTKDIGKEGDVNLSFTFSNNVFQLKNDIKDLDISVGYPENWMKKNKMNTETNGVTVHTTDPVTINAPENTLEASTEDSIISSKKKMKITPVAIAGIIIIGFIIVSILKKKHMGNVHKCLRKKK